MSKVIKSQWAGSICDEQKVIAIKMLQSVKQDESLSAQYQYEVDELLQHAYEKAEIIVKEAEMQAESIREQAAEERSAWEQERAKLIEEAKREGFLQGTNEGKMQGYQEYHDAIVFAQEVIHTAKKDYESQVASAEKTILNIALNAAEKILGAKLSESEEVFLAVVKRAMREVRSSREVQLHVHPCHFEFLLSRKEELSFIFPKEAEIYIFPNDELGETDCFIESANGRIDASIDTQLEELKRKLLELMESESG